VIAGAAPLTSAQPRPTKKGRAGVRLGPFSLFVVAINIFSACSARTEETPMDVCNDLPKDQLQSLFTEISGAEIVPAGETFDLAAQVTSGKMFCPAQLLLPDAVASLGYLTVVGVYSPDGKNMLLNGQETRAEFFSNKNEFAGKINGCCVRTGLSFVVRFRNIRSVGWGDFALQAQLMGVYR
jgi:hypothetical protein